MSIEASITAIKATHILTIDDERQCVVAIAYRPDPSFDADVEGGRITPRLATPEEVKTGKSKSGKPVVVSLARPVVAAQLFERIRRYGYDGQYLGSSQLANGPLGSEWEWSAGNLLSNGERPRANLSWDLEPVERDASGAIVNKITNAAE